MGIVRVYKIKIDDGQEVVVHEPLGFMEVVTLSIYDKDNNLKAEVKIDQESWEAIKGNG